MKLRSSFRFAARASIFAVGLATLSLAKQLPAEAAEQSTDDPEAERAQPPQTDAADQCDPFTDPFPAVVLEHQSIYAGQIEAYVLARGTCVWAEVYTLSNTNLCAGVGGYPWYVGIDSITKNCAYGTYVRSAYWPGNAHSPDGHFTAYGATFSI